MEIRSRILYLLGNQSLHIQIEVINIINIVGTRVETLFSVVYSRLHDCTSHAAQ